MATTEPMPDAYIAEFLDLARSANVTFDITEDRRKPPLKAAVISLLPWASTGGRSA